MVITLRCLAYCYCSHPSFAALARAFQLLSSCNKHRARAADDRVSPQPTAVALHKVEHSLGKAPVRR